MAGRKAQEMAPAAAALHVDGTAVISMLADSIKDLKNDMNRNFDLLVGGQRKIYDEFQSHCKEDDKQFGEIKQLTAEAKGEATAKADALREKSEKENKKMGWWMVFVTAFAGIGGIDIL